MRGRDAYQAAGKVVDAARDLPDLAGVLVLVDRARDALASARSLAEGGRKIPPSPLCFFNPLHGDATVTVDWRPIGQRDRLRVQACRACSKAVRSHRMPSDQAPHHMPGAFFYWIEGEAAATNPALLASAVGALDRVTLAMRHRPQASDLRGGRGHDRGVVRRRHRDRGPGRHAADFWASRDR